MAKLGSMKEYENRFHNIKISLSKETFFLKFQGILGNTDISGKIVLLCPRTMFEKNKLFSQVKNYLVASKLRYA